MRQPLWQRRWFTCDSSEFSGGASTVVLLSHIAPTSCPDPNWQSGQADKQEISSGNGKQERSRKQFSYPLYGGGSWLIGDHNPYFVIIYLQKELGLLLGSPINWVASKPMIGYYLFLRSSVPAPVFVLLCWWFPLFPPYPQSRAPVTHDLQWFRRHEACCSVYRRVRCEWEESICLENLSACLRNGLKPAAVMTGSQLSSSCHCQTSHIHSARQTCAWFSVTIWFPI